MKVTITKQLGSANLVFEVEGVKADDTLALANVATAMPESCGLCGDTNLQLLTSKNGGYTFNQVKCLNCGAASKMGQFKDGIGCFWNTFEKYDPTASKGGEK